MEVFNEAFNYKFNILLEEETIGVSERDCRKYCKVSLKSPRRFLEKMITAKYGHKVTNYMIPKIRKHFPRQQMFYYTSTDDPEDEDAIIYQYYKGNIDLRKFNNKRVRRATFKDDFKQVRKLRVDELKRCVTKLEFIEDEEYPWAVFCRVISRRSPIIYPSKEEFEVMLGNIHIYKGWVRKALEMAKSELESDDEDAEESSEESEENATVSQEVEQDLDPPWFDEDDIESVGRFIREFGPTISLTTFRRFARTHAVNAELREAMEFLISEDNDEFARDRDITAPFDYDEENDGLFYDPSFLYRDYDEDF